MFFFYFFNINLKKLKTTSNTKMLATMKFLTKKQLVFKFEIFKLYLYYYFEAKEIKDINHEYM